LDTDFPGVCVVLLLLEVWTIDSAKTILALPSYISGVTSNKLHASRLLKEQM
jgi:hypothetical protein